MKYQFNQMNLTLKSNGNTTCNFIAMKLGGEQFMKWCEIRINTNSKGINVYK